jgi:dTMP kinase
MSARGRFIVLEGGEGAGKSTQVETVCQWLQAQGRRWTKTREPGGSPVAEAIRELLLRSWPAGMDPRSELLLMFAARANHVHSLIEPSLAADQDVVCDRFVDASYAYQGGGRGLAAADIEVLERWVLGPLRPDLVLLLDVDPEEGRRRVARRGAADRFEQENLEFQRRVRAIYRARAQSAPERYAIIDASQNPSEVARAVCEALARHLGVRA